MGRTTKPCPGCSEVISSRSANEVCYKCRELIDEAKAHRERVSQETETGVFRLAYHHYSLPFIDHCARERIQRPFQELIYSVGLPVDTSEQARYDVPALIEKSDTGRGVDWARRVPLSFRESANQLYRSIQKATEEAYQNGYKDGQNLIVQLARGEVSLNEFREESGERPRRR